MYQSPEHSAAAVYAAPKTMPEKKPRTPLSVRTQTIIGASLIVLLFLAVSAVNLTLAKAYYQPDDDNGLGARLQSKAHLIESRLSYLRQLIEKIARQPTTQDLISSGDRAQAQRWALQMQRFFPQALGVATIDAEARVLGEPPNHQIGPFCLTDLAQLSQGVRIPSPPVHLQAQPRPHFDLTAPVFDEAENRLGLLFVSFGLDSLQALLDDGRGQNQQFTLRDGHGKVFMQSGQRPAESSTHSAQWPLRNSDWQLSLSEPATSATPSFISLLMFNVSAFLLIVGSIALLVRRHTRRIEGDFRQVREHIEHLADGQADAPAPEPGVGAAAHILPALGRIRQNLSAQQQSSRKVDLAARLDDDHFALLLFNIQREGIELCLQRLCEHFEEQQRKHPDIPFGKHCTLRLGHTLIHRHRDNDPGQVLARADQALEAADDKQPIVGR